MTDPHNEDCTRSDCDIDPLCIDCQRLRYEKSGTGYPASPRFQIDTDGGLPAVRDRVHDGAVVARFITLKAAERYKRRREYGMGHGPAMMDAEGVRTW